MFHIWHVQLSGTHGQKLGKYTNIYVHTHIYVTKYVMKILPRELKKIQTALPGKEDATSKLSYHQEDADTED